METFLVEPRWPPLINRLSDIKGDARGNCARGVSEKKGGRKGEGKKKRNEGKRRKSNYSTGIIINSRLVPRAELFVRGTRQDGKGGRGRGERETRARGTKKKENGTFVEKLTTPPRILPPRIAIDVVLTEGTNNPTNCEPCPSSRERARRPFHDAPVRSRTFSPSFSQSLASRRPLPLPPPPSRCRVFARRAKALRKICQYEQKPDRRARKRLRPVRT